MANYWLSNWCPLRWGSGCIPRPVSGNPWLSSLAIRSLASREQMSRGWRYGCQKCGTPKEILFGFPLKHLPPHKNENKAIVFSLETPPPKVVPHKKQHLGPTKPAGKARARQPRCGLPVQKALAELPEASKFARQWAGYPPVVLKGLVKALNRLLKVSF